MFLENKNILLKIKKKMQNKASFHMTPYKMKSDQKTIWILQRFLINF